MSSNAKRPTPSRGRRALVSLAAVVATLLATLLIGSGTAYAAGCNQPAAGRNLNGDWNQGWGQFSCSSVYYLQSKVELWTRTNATAPYELRTTTGWVNHVNGNWGQLTNYVETDPLDCQSMYIRAWVQWKVTQGQANWTQATQIHTYAPCS